MSNINNQAQDLYSIELVQDLDHEDAATVSGGALVLTTDRGGDGNRRRYTRRRSTLGSLNNEFSWYEVTGNRDWFAWTGQNFTGRRYRLRAGGKGNLRPGANDNFESIRPA
jgi:hypothetical protein